MRPAAATRVPEHTAEQVNERIRRHMEANIAYFAAHPDEIGQRLGELDEEWDIERRLEVNAAAIVLGGTLLGTLFGRKWRILPLVAAGFLLQHALQGWCPPLSLLRRMGIRTRREIDEERYALKALRGDFQPVKPDADALNRTSTSLQASRA